MAQFCTGAGSVRQNGGRRRPGVWSQEFPVSGGSGAVAAGAFRAGGSGQAVPGAFRVRRAWDTRCRMLSGFGGSWPAAASGTGGARMLDHFLSDPWVLPLLLSDCPVAGSGGESGQRTMGSLWLKIWIQLGTELWTSWLCIRSRELSGMTLMGSRIWFRRRHSSRPMSEKSTRMVR